MLLSSLPEGNPRALFPVNPQNQAIFLHKPLFHKTPTPKESSYPPHDTITIYQGGNQQIFYYVSLIFQISTGGVATIVTSLVILFTFFLTTATTHAQVTPGDPGNFITTWNTENPGTSGSNQITIPGTGTNYHIYWENTASSTMTGATTVSNATTLTFPEPGIYRVEIAGAFTRIRFNNGGDRQKILTVEQWGDIAWSSMREVFFGASNLRVPATDAPDLSGVTDMRAMFRGATAFNDPVDHWDVSTIEDMHSLFRDATSFNQPLNNWNVSEVAFLESIFFNTLFNQPLNNWNTSNVERFAHMFQNTPFNQDISMWDTSNAIFMHVMFSGSASFNQDLSNWDTSNVTSMLRMFEGATSFNQNLSTWNISSTTNMTNMFLNAGLSQSNQDATLTSFASQATTHNLTNIPLHIGLKTYSTTGATAIQTLRDLGWTITEQYQATYSPSTRATLLGQGTQSPLNSNDTTTAVTIKPDNRCTFNRWSDGNTDNPRQDTLVDDNLAVSAIIHCPSSGGTTLATRITNLENSGNQAEADKLRAQFQLTTTTTTTQTNSTQPATLEDTLASVRSLLEQPLPTNPQDQSKAKELLSLLLELVKALSQLLLTTALTSAEEGN
ncbi:MAG: BspA family leucine-rich repeat surface protein [Candidatus Paceibacteria bacterium]